jgi:LysR family glycine cleavage system transcriptional activator
MAARIPPLTALRAFEAAARLNSFTRAAEELFVTPAAISQQIKVLEDFTQVRLFERTNRGIRVTEAGANYYPMISEGFATLQRATQQLRAFRPADRLVVSVWPSLASHWLGPGLYKWLDTHANMQITITASVEEPDFELSDVDVRVSYGEPKGRDLVAEVLLTDVVIPVCSPAFLELHGGLRTPQALLECELIHTDWGDGRDALPSWHKWGEALGLSALAERPGPMFNFTNLAIQTAVDGKGVALAPRLMATQELNAGRLVQVGEHRVPMPQPYYLVYPERVLGKPYGRAFVEWLRSLAAPARSRLT